MARESLGVLLLREEMIAAVEEDGGAATEVVLGSGQEDRLDCVQFSGWVSTKLTKIVCIRLRCASLPVTKDQIMKLKRCLHLFVNSQNLQEINGIIPRSIPALGSQIARVQA